MVGNIVYLRALEPSDIDFLYRLENQTDLWHLSDTQTPYSKALLQNYLNNTHKDIYQVKQLRLAIDLKDTMSIVGLIDLFDFDPKNKRAGLGICVLESEHRHKGIGTEAVQILLQYAFTHLQLHQVYVNIDAYNTPSKQLFTKLGFEKIGIKKDWNFNNGYFSDEEMYQLINPNI